MSKTLNCSHIYTRCYLEGFRKKTGLRNVVKLTGKHLLKSHFNIVAGSWPVTALKRESNTDDSMMNF